MRTARTKFIATTCKKGFLLNAGIQSALVACFALLVPGAGSIGAEELRNPFALPPGVFVKKSLPESAQPAPPPVHLTLQAVTRFMGKKVASINNKNYELGDDVYGKTIVEIGNESVVLADKTGRISLSITRPEFSVQVVEGF